MEGYEELYLRFKDEALMQKAILVAGGILIRGDVESYDLLWSLLDVSNNLELKKIQGESSRN